MRSAQLESAGVQMMVVDVCGGDVCEAVSSELRVWDGELEVRYEDGQRLVKRYELAAEDCSEEERHGVEVVPVTATADVAGGTFIAMGGLGGIIGLLTAKVLAVLGAARLVLLSRSGKLSHEGQGLEAELS